MRKQKNGEKRSTYFVISIFILLIIVTGIVNFIYESKTQKTYTCPKETLSPYDAEAASVEMPTNLFFGMKESEIIKLYGEPYREYGDIISYKLTNTGTDFDKRELVLGITENGLQMVQYAYGYSYDSDPKPYLKNTEEIKSMAVNRYGDNFNYTENWTNEKYKNDFESWGKAIENRHLEIVYTWDLDDFTITLRTTDVGVFLDYTAK